LTLLSRTLHTKALGAGFSKLQAARQARIITQIDRTETTLKSAAPSVIKQLVFGGDRAAL
jgi:hypothetical protein